MSWSVRKTGAALFDALHAYGLGIVLASVSGQPIEVCETGPSYTLTVPGSSPLVGTLSLIESILVLPSLQELEATRLVDATLPIANLDGLLTVLFTTPGARLLSVADLVRKARGQKDERSVHTRALEKVRKALVRWQTWAAQESARANGSWLEQLQQDYQATSLALPLPVTAQVRRDLSLLMMLDPAFSYSTRRPRSDGLVSQKTQVAIRSPRFAVLLAIMGAARFLRAQRVGGDLVNCYVPRAERLLLHADSCLPLLFPLEAEAHQAALVQGLSLTSLAAPLGATRPSLAYQTLRTQGANQSIPADHGCLDLTWFETLPVQVRDPLRTFWRWLLTRPPEGRPCEVDDLIDALWDRAAPTWLAHVDEVAWRVHATAASTHAGERMRAYTLEELKEVTFAMTMPIPSLLQQTLTRKTGTLRFGQALRLLGEYHAGELRELIDELETVTTLDQLLAVLALTAQHCQVAAAKTPFMLVPTEDDLGALLLDTEQAGSQTIASFLIVLSALRYPRLARAERRLPSSLRRRRGQGLRRSLTPPPSLHAKKGRTTR